MKKEKRKLKHKSKLNEIEKTMWCQLFSNIYRVVSTKRSKWCAYLLLNNTSICNLGVPIVFYILLKQGRVIFPQLTCKAVLVLSLWFICTKLILLDRWERCCLIEFRGDYYLYFRIKKTICQVWLYSIMSTYFIIEIRLSKN